MARRRFRAKAKRAVRYISKAMRRRGKRKGSSVKMVQFDSMLYGGLREKLSTAISPLTAKIPLGGIADEVGMGALCYLVAKKTSGMAKDIAMKGLVIENARVGEAIVQGGLGLGFLSPSKGMDTYTYG